MGQIQLFNNIYNTWNHVTVCKQETDFELLVLRSNTGPHLIE